MSGSKHGICSVSRYHLLVPGVRYVTKYHSDAAVTGGVGRFGFPYCSHFGHLFKPFPQLLSFGFVERIDGASVDQCSNREPCVAGRPQTEPCATPTVLEPEGIEASTRLESPAPAEQGILTRRQQKKKQRKSSPSSGGGGAIFRRRKKKKQRKSSPSSGGGGTIFRRRKMPPLERGTANRV